MAGGGLVIGFFDEAIDGKNAAAGCRSRADVAILRRRPDRVPEATYPEGATVRKVGQVGDVRWKGCRIMAGRGLAGEPVRVEERDGQVEVYYCTRRVRCLAIAELRRDKML